MRSCSVDYVATGGDYDFQLLGVCRHLCDGAALPKGIWYREKSQIRNTGPFELAHDLNALPFIDRDLTKWRLYSEQNGNYKRTPGTYTMAGRDCWWAKCTFCSWTTTYPKFRTRTPESLLDEVGMLVERYKVREIFDDTGTFPAGGWLEKFCKGMIERGYNDKIYFSCNMRAGALTKQQYALMGRAGFRMLLYGLESANQQTLDRLHKGTKAEQIAADCRMAKGAGMEPHLTAMVGYPWETKSDAEQTIALAKRIFDDGFADTLQATIVIPYPGTPLFEECKKNGWLLTDDWSRYDMREPVMRTAMSATEIKALTQNLYRVFTSPRYAMRKLSGMRSVEDLRFLKKGAKALMGHLRDFS
jgi:radical SAM superfamily enzyme YgiQ (UPF0313 family)